MPSAADFLILAPACFLKELEQPCVYNTATDELYELDGEAFFFLCRCDGTRRLEELSPPADFLDYCLKEGILALTPNPRPRTLRPPEEPSPTPSLRYLELQVTARCNLRCRHCYQGEPRAVDLPLEGLLPLLEEFDRMGGLRLLISGGEPLTHPAFYELNEALPGFGFRSILLTNGHLLDREAARRLRVQEVQLSLDGLEGAHDGLRGRGSFRRAVRAAEAVREAGLALSVATMVTALNRGDFPGMEQLLSSWEAKAWTVDVPVMMGRGVENPGLFLPYEEAAPRLAFSFGGGLYSSGGDYACGAHLCAVLPQGSVCKCGYFSSSPVGNIREGLRACWGRLAPLRLEALECRCPYLRECRGGCRYRAQLWGGGLAPDPVQCLTRGWVTSRCLGLNLSRGER